MKVRCSSRGLQSFRRLLDQLPSVLGSAYPLRERNALRLVRLLLKRLV